MSINSLFNPNSYDLFCDELSCNSLNTPSISASGASFSGAVTCNTLTVTNDPLNLGGFPVPNVLSYTYDAPVRWSGGIGQLVRDGEPVTCTCSFKKLGITGTGNSLMFLEVGPAYGLFGDTNLSGDGLVYIDLSGANSDWIPIPTSPNYDFSFAAAVHNDTGISQTTTAMGSFYYSAVDKLLQIGQNGVQVFTAPSAADKASGSNYRFYCNYFI